MGVATYIRTVGPTNKVLKMKRGKPIEVPWRPLANRGAPAAGTGYIAGKLSGDASLTLATIRILYRHATQGALGDGYLVATVTPDAVGNWRVDGLNTSLKYDIVARRAGYNDVITANVTPLPA